MRWSFFRFGWLSPFLGGIRVFAICVQDMLWHILWRFFFFFFLISLVCYFVLPIGLFCCCCCCYICITLKHGKPEILYKFSIDMYPVYSPPNQQQLKKKKKHKTATTRMVRDAGRIKGFPNTKTCFSDIIFLLVLGMMVMGWVSCGIFG